VKLQGIALLDEVESLLRMRDHQTHLELAQALRARGFEVAPEQVDKALRRNPERFHGDRSTLRHWHLVFDRRPAQVELSESNRAPRVLIDQLPSLYPWQEEALQRWSTAGRRGVIEAVTGAGKTLLGVRAALEAAGTARPVLVLVPTTALLLQWQEQLWEAMPGVRVGLVGAGERDELRYKDIIVSTVQSASRQQTELGVSSGGLLIGDEAHRYGAVTFGRALMRGYDWRLGLTATYQRGDEANAKVLDPYFGGVCFRLGYERALLEEAVAPFALELRGVTLDADSEAVYRKNVEIAARARQHLIRRFGLPEQPFTSFLAATVRLSQSPESPPGRAARSYLAAFKAYRTALAEAPAKLEMLRQLAPRVAASSGAIAFTESIASCESAADVLRQHGVLARAVHSELDHDERNALLHQFGTKGLDCLVAPRILDEGIDVPEADLGIIIAASSSRRQMIQRMGRVIRRKADGREACFVILYARGTREDPAQGAHETFLDEVLSVARSVRSC